LSYIGCEPEQVKPVELAAWTIPRDTTENNSPVNNLSLPLKGMSNSPDEIIEVARVVVSQEVSIGPPTEGW